MKKHIRIGIIGVGMVGDPLRRFFEEFKGFKRGENIFLYDIDPGKEYSDEINQADVIFICVPSPRSRHGDCDISEVDKSLDLLKDGKIGVIKSTVPPGTTEFFQKKYPHLKILFNPEFLTERRSWEDTLKPDRQIVGHTEKSIDVAGIVLALLPKAPFMSPWGQNTYKPIRISATEAEIIKYGTNIHFVRKVNFANVLAKIADNLGINYENIRMGMSADFRIGDSHLDVDHGGYRGWGGYCFPKDLDALISYCDKIKFNECSELLKSDRKFNERLLAMQGLSLENMAIHSEPLEHRIKSERKKKSEKKENRK